MAPLFKYPAAAAQPVGPSPPPLPDSFATRLQRSGSPSENLEDRRPRRPGVIPGQYAPASEDEEAAWPASPPPPGPAVATGLARDAGLSNLTVTGAMREFAGVSDAAARQANITKRRIGEARNNDVLAACRTQVSVFVRADNSITRGDDWRIHGGCR